MVRYGEANIENPVFTNFLKKTEGIFPFKLYPRLWATKELTPYYTDRAWLIVPFTDSPPDLPDEPGIYMFVAGPYCGGLADHSYIFYVGEATSLRRRYPRYLEEEAGVDAIQESMWCCSSIILTATCTFITRWCPKKNSRWRKIY